jgi:ABC-type polar amino acid transport system ATPase subunit
MRIDIAGAICLPEKVVIFDEFTSDVDREDYDMARNVRHYAGRQFIAVTCHFDVVDWLEPDWTYN